MAEWGCGDSPWILYGAETLTQSNGATPTEGATFTIIEELQTDNRKGFIFALVITIIGSVIVSELGIWLLRLVHLW